MVATDAIVLGLLVTALVFSIIELGISAYFVHFTTGEQYVTQYDPSTGDVYSGYYHFKTPSWLGFLLFCSIWSILVSAALMVLGLMKSVKVNHKTLGIGSLALTGVTMIFWLAGFAAYAAAVGVGYYPGTAGALLAFAILLWLIYLALTVLNALAAFGVITSGRAGHGKVFGRSAYTGPGGAPQSTPMNTYGASNPGAHPTPSSAYATNSYDTPSSNTYPTQPANTYQTPSSNMYQSPPANTYGDGPTHGESAPGGHYAVTNNAMHEPSQPYNYNKE